MRFEISKYSGVLSLFLAALLAIFIFHAIPAQSSVDEYVIHAGSETIILAQLPAPGRPHGVTTPRPPAPPPQGPPAPNPPGPPTSSAQQPPTPPPAPDAPVLPDPRFPGTGLTPQGPW